MYLQNSLVNSASANFTERVIVSEKELAEKHREDIEVTDEVPRIYVQVAPAKLSYSTPDNTGRQRSIRFFG